MSKKFEIINDKWIRDLQTEPKVSTRNRAIKISAIHSLLTIDADEIAFKGGWCIMLSFSGTGLRIYYKKDEKDEYEADLKLLEDILFKQ